jgi:hypothetical protein
MRQEEITRIQDLPSLIERETDPERLKAMARELENLLSQQSQKFGRDWFQHNKPQVASSAAHAYQAVPGLLQPSA